MRSSYIDWLLLQHDRADKTGELSRWVKSQDEFEPVEFHDILERIKESGESEMTEIAVDSLVEYASMLTEEGAKVFVIDDKELMKERLNIAIKQEKYEEAAKLRDQLKKNGNKEEQAEP